MDPQAAAVEHSVTTPTSPGQANRAQGTNTPEWPAPQRYEPGRGLSSNAGPRPGGATLGVNVVGSEDGQGVIVGEDSAGDAGFSNGAAATRSDSKLEWTTGGVGR